jgi:hypothetical protein
LIIPLLVVVALATQLHYNLNHHGSAINFFSFFTVLSNIIGTASMLISAGFSMVGKRSPKLDYLRGAATFYMIVTGIVYALLLSGANVQTALSWVNDVIHRLFPVVMILDWLLDRPARAISAKRAVAWLIFPVAYLSYTLVRGAFVHWYPYPFLDVSTLGYSAVVINSVVIAIMGAIAAIMLARLSGVQSKKAHKRV